MEISKGLAQNIVDDTKKIIGKDLNFIKINGEIIASTDKKRIGSFHEGALKAIKLEKIVTIDWDEQYPGSKKGINIPVKFYDEIIGVIGISGDKNEVGKYGEIIKRITEILIKEAFLMKKEERENENERIILDSILSIEEKKISKSTVIYKELEKIIKAKSKVFITSQLELKDEYDFETMKKIFSIYKKKVKKNQGYLLINQNIITILLLNKNYDEIEKIIIGIKKEIEKNDRIKLFFGVGEIKKEATDVKQSYIEALNALKWSIKNREELIFFEKMDIEILLNEINEEVLNKYKERILKNLTPVEIEEYKKIFFNYENYDGSLKKVSKELFMHINTLQYKLNKFNEKTGFDIRKYRDFSKIKLAFMTY